MIERIVSLLQDWRRLTETLEATLVDNLAATAPWLAPLAPAYLAYRAMLVVLDFPAWVAIGMGLTVELLGISTINTSITFWSYNREKNKSDNAAPTWLAVAAAGFYLAVVLVVNVLLDAADPVQRVAKALLSSLSVVAAITLALRSQHARRVSEARQQKEERRETRRLGKLLKAESEKAKVPAKVTERPDGAPETYGRWRRWPEVPVDEQMKIVRMRVDQVMELYGVDERTAYNWLKYAERDHGLAGEVARFQVEQAGQGEE